MTIPVTRHCCRPQGTVWVNKHFDQKSQVMATLGMANIGTNAVAWEAAWLNMAVSTRQQTDLDGLDAVAPFKAAKISASGVVTENLAQYLS